MSEGSLLTVHRQLLDQRRGRVNLVGPGDVEVHYTDCAEALTGLTPTGRWVDLGSGAGFPGIVFADRFPDVPLELVDSRQKRALFLEHVLTRAGIDPDRVRVRCVRVEALDDRAYDGVLARAFAPPGVVIEVAARLLRPAGIVVLFLQHDTPLPPHPGFEVVQEHAYRVAGKSRRSVLLRRGAADGVSAPTPR